MKNKFLYIFLIIISSNLNFSYAYSAEVFNFDVTEVEIIEEGNKFIGKKGETATTEDGIIINEKNFDGTFSSIFIDDSSKQVSKIIYAKNGLIIDNDKKKIFKLYDGEIINNNNSEINVF